MAVYVILSPEQLALEEQADALLGGLIPDPDRPFYTEKRLLRRERYAIHVDALADVISSPSLSLQDEVHFLMSLSRLPRVQRLCLELWLDGWSQQDIAKTVNLCQQRISQLLACALRVCYSLRPLSFREFSRHAIYHAPAHRRQQLEGMCLFCGEAYPRGAGWGRYCSERCQETSKHNRARKTDTLSTE